jgi:CBS domain-containing protein
MSLLDICDQSPPTVSPEATAADAIRAMLDNHVGAITVVDEHHVVAGIFTERDVLRKLSLSGLDPKATPVRNLMTRPVEMATEQTSNADALAVMLLRHYRHLPIVDANGRLLGMLSIRHLLQNEIDGLLQQVHSLQPSANH